MSDKIHAPFTEQQAQALNHFQVARQFHPFTCPREHLSSSDSLVAVAGQGWVCPSAQCDYTQDWAHAFMAEVQVKPRWTDLIGIDPDYTDGVPVDEWLEAKRAANFEALTDAERLISWAGLMELLDEHWPADIFPTLESDPERDASARIVSLLRWVDRDRAALARVEAVCATAIRVRTERMVEGSIVHIAAKDAIDTFAEAIREAAMVDTDAHWLGRLPYRDNPDNRPRMGETATQFLARMFEQTKRAPITYPNPDSSKLGAKAAIKAFIARGRFKR